LELADTPWMRWKEVNENYPAAEVGAYVNDDAYSVVVPIYYGSRKPSFDMLTEVLLDNVDFDYPPQAVNDKELFQDGAIQGSQIKYTYKSRDDVYDVRCKIISGSQTGLLAAVWMKDRFPDKERLFKQFFNRVRVSSQMSRSIDDLLLGQEQKTMQANLINSLGLEYHKREKYEFALYYFKLASELLPENGSYLTNCLDSFNRLGSHQDALAFLASHKDGLTDNPEVLSWKAWHFNKADKKDQALACYKKLFAANYKNDEDFDVYVELLAEKKQWEQFEAAFEAYLKHDESLALKLKHAEILQKHGNHEKAIDKLLALQNGLPFKSEIAYALIQNYNAFGQPKSALAVSNKLIENGHRTAGVYYNKGYSEYRLKWYRKAKKSFEKAHELAPNDNGISDYIKHVSSLLGEGNNSSVKRPVKPVAIPELIKGMMASGKVAVENDGFDSYYLNIIRGYSYKRGEHYRQTTYKRIKVLNANGVSRFSTLEIDFDPLSERIYVNNLVVRDPKGDIVSKGNPDDYYVIDKQKAEMATYDQTLFIPVPNLLPGYTIEIASTVERMRAPTAFPFVKNVMGASRPVHFYAVFYEGDSKAICHKPVNTAPPVATKNGLAWIVEDPPIYRWEPLMVHHEVFFPVVLMGSSERRWKQIGQEYLERIKDALASDSQVRTLAKQLVQNATSAPAKVNRLALYVQKNYAYKAVEFGSRGLIPNSADLTIQNKYGDCKDHALLLHQLLHAVSVPSQLALVNTRSRVEPLLPSMDQFNHMIIFIPAETGGRFLDVTDKDIDLTLATPVGLADRAALILEPGKIHFAKIPAYDDNSFVKIKREIEIVNRGDQRIAEHVELSGYVAGFFRNTLKSIEKDGHLDWMQQMGDRYQSALNILSFDVSHLFDNAKPLILDLTYEINGPAFKEMAQSNLKVPCIWEHYYLDERPVKDRRTDFKISYPFMLQSNVVLKAPNGFIVSEFDPIEDGGSGAFGQWRIQIKKTRHACYLDLNCKRVPGVFNSDSYEHYQLMMGNAVQAINRNVFFEPEELTARTN
jgi:tetratricopeptide (TPR) repeat protein